MSKYINNLPSNSTFVVKDNVGNERFTVELRTEMEEVEICKLDGKSSIVIEAPCMKDMISVLEDCIGIIDEHIKQGEQQNRDNNE